MARFFSRFRPAALLVLLALLCLPGHSQGLAEADLARAYPEQVRPFLAQQFTFATLTSGDGLTLRYAKRRAAQGRASLVLVMGRTEFMEKYAELLFDLRDLPLSFYLFDQRGQGLSSRLLAEHDKGHVGDFADYGADLALFLRTVVRAEQPGPVVLLGHSMGGLVAALHANAHPEEVAGLVLSAPMLAIDTRPLPEWFARALARAAVSLGQGGHYVPGGRPYTPDKAFAANDVTSSLARFALNQGLVRETPGNALGSPTYTWVRQAFLAMDGFAREHRQLTMPILLLQAEADQVVKNEPQTALCRALPDCSLVVLPGARHEILMERDAVRDLALARVRAFVLGLDLGTAGPGGRP